MGELGLNKILGAILATALGLFALHELTLVVFGHGGGKHGHHHDEVEKSLTEQMSEKFSYAIEIADTGGGAEVVEEVFDLGLALINADISKGERAFKAKCATCHTIEQGGANGTGPNLWATIGLDKAGHAGFSYSNALQGMDGEWSYENMNDWLYNPSAYVRGTSMAFAGLRRDSERADVIAYLASFTPDAAPFPDPLPAAGEAPVEGEATEAEIPEGDAGEGEATDAAPADDTAEAPAPEVTIEDATAPAESAVEAAVTEATDAVETVTETATEAVTAAEDTLVDEAAAATETATEGAASIIEDAAETAEDMVEDAQEELDPETVEP